MGKIQDKIENRKVWIEQANKKIALWEKELNELKEETDSNC